MRKGDTFFGFCKKSAFYLQLFILHLFYMKFAFWKPVTIEVHGD